MRIGGIELIANRWRSAVVVNGGIGVCVWCNVRPRLVNVRRYTVIGQTMAAASECHGSMGREHAESIEGGDSKCRPRAHSFA